MMVCASITDDINGNLHEQPCLNGRTCTSQTRIVGSEITCQATWTGHWKTLVSESLLLTSVR
jgi:hypothetical protein